MLDVIGGLPMLTTKGRRRLVVSVLLLFGSAAMAAKGSAIAADNLTTAYSLSSFNYGIGFAGRTSIGPFRNATPAQEFTALVSGTVIALTATVGQFQAQQVPLTVSIFTVANGLPATSLGAVSFPQTQVSPNAFMRPSIFDFSAANTSVTAGQSYFARFSVPRPLSGSNRYEAVLLNHSARFFGFPALDSPDGGETWLAPPISNEIGLTVIVNQTPEPISIGLAALGIGTLRVVLRQRKRRIP